MVKIQESTHKNTDFWILFKDLGIYHFLPLLAADKGDLQTSVLPIMSIVMDSESSLLCGVFPKTNLFYALL